VTKIYLYIVGASADPDYVRCPVPWQVDAQLIFFGPCKKHIREEIRHAYLSQSETSVELTEPIYLVGVNASNGRHIRKIVWAGRLLRVMTFAEAYDRMSADSRFQKLRDYKLSPLHLKPMYVGEELRGYEHISREHEEGDAWMMDLLTSPRSPQVTQDGPRLLLRSGVSPWDGFPRDACFLLDNEFFAKGDGLPIDRELVSILGRAQPGVLNIDSYAIFGRRHDGSIEGRTGRHLTIDDDGIADDLLKWLRREAKLRPQPTAR
jgi:hypothetical protein